MCIRDRLEVAPSPRIDNGIQLTVQGGAQALLAELAAAKDARKREKLLGEIDREVRVHSTIEEEIFYPAYREAVRSKEDRELYQEALEEHHVVDLVLPEIKGTNPASEVFGAKAKVLKELIEHHAEEEEKEMFKRARRVMDTAQLRELGQRMAQRKKQLAPGR